VHLAPHKVRQPRSDGATFTAARGTAAFGQLYNDHFDGLFDFVARIVRDRDLAGEVVQSTFTKAWDELRAGREIKHPKAWLYAVARNHALDELRRHKRLTDDAPIYAQPDPSRLADPQAVAEDNELVDLVWTSAAALSPDEYSLLDLHVRHGFDAAALADALDLERGAVYTRLSRLRSSLEESVTSTLLVRRGSEDCDGLKAIIAEHDGGESITRELRAAVRAHVKECDVCSEARRRVASPVGLFGAMVPIVPLAGMREGILGAILPSGSHAATAGVGAGGAVVAARQAGKAKYVVGAGGIAAAAVVVSIALSAGPGVRDPARAESVDHAIGVASPDNTVTMRWAPGKNAQGYSVIFSRNRSDEPPARENVTGTQYTSRPLAPGRWWFILRSHGSGGGWTDTLRVGPFVITAPVARQATTPKAKPQRKRAVHRPERKPPRRKVKAVATRPTPSGQIVAGAQTRPVHKPVAPPKPKAKAKPKPPKPKPKPPKPKPKDPPPQPPPPAATTPPPAETPSPPLAETPVVPPPVHQDDDHGDEKEHDDDDHGEDHDEDDEKGGKHGDHGGAD
jgi:RNA polymerase sigma factor (sigma-70 family)